MLHTEAVSEKVLELLKKLQQKQYLDQFYLVGGTALALYYGHRKSIDIDLFSNKAFDAERLLEQVSDDFSYQLFSTAEQTLKGRIKEINVDIIAHRYPYIEEPYYEDGFSLLSEKDIIAMKLNAIAVSGQRSKDFIDLYYALNRYKFDEIISFYKTKYEQKIGVHVLKSLAYFEDVDLGDWPILLRDPNLKWSSIKNRLTNEVKNYTLE